jgi:hypothetical protein
VERRRFRPTLLALTAAFVAAGAPAIASPLFVSASGRVITPNGDGINDHVGFQLEHASEARGMVYSVNGRRIASLIPVQDGLAWNGFEGTGRQAESGVYVVQIVRGADLWQGVVTVAR